MLNKISDFDSDSESMDTESSTEEHYIANLAD